jgi:hypothetical protein
MRLDARVHRLDAYPIRAPGVAELESWARGLSLHDIRGVLAFREPEPGRKRRLPDGMSRDEASARGHALVAQAPPSIQAALGPHCE